MTFTAIISLITSVAKAFPKFKEWWDGLIVAYVETQKASMKKETKEAIRKAIDEDDQRPLEEVIGYSRAGELSGIPGSVVVDALPSVRNPRRD